MRRPFRRYCFHLAEKLGKSLDEIMSLGSNTISEWMAFDLSNDNEWQDQYKKDLELERQRDGKVNKVELFKQLIGGK